MPLNARTTSLGALFTVPGLAMASWVVRTPAIRDDLAATTAEMGLVLLGMSAGSILGVLAAGPLVARHGARTVMVNGLLGVATSLAVIGLAAWTGGLATAAAGLLLFGAGMGAAEVAVNVEAADVERVRHRPVLVLLHGCYSLGTLIGALVGMALTAAGFSAAAHMGLLAAVAFAVVAVSIRQVPAGTGVRVGGGARRRALPARRGRAGRGPRRRSALLDGYLLAISAIALSVALAEGAATDWLPLLMVDDYDFGATSGSGIYVLFALCMTAGRFSSSVLLRRWSKRSVLVASTLTSVAALLGITLVHDRTLAVAAIVLWGLGASVSFPVALSAAGDGSDDAAARVTVVSMAGYLSMLVGPPVLGLVGEHAGLRHAMVVPLILLVGAAWIAVSLPAERIAGVRAASPADRRSSAEDDAQSSAIVDSHAP